MDDIAPQLSTADAAGLTRPAAAASRSPRRIKTPAAVGAAVLLSFLCCSWAGAAHAQLPIPANKVIRIYNNSKTETMYAVLQIGKRDTDEWMQAYYIVPKAEIKTRLWPSKQVYRVYINGLKGIPHGGSAIISVPFFTYLVQPNAAKLGVKPDLVIDWWNGGRVSIYDQFGSAAYRKDYNKDLATTGNPLVPPQVGGGNPVITCVSGDCQKLDIFAGNTVLPGNDPDQLSEYTFGDSITADGAPYPFNPKMVGYNISSVDQLYLPLAMEPAGNKLIPYIGSVETPEQFRATMARWLEKHPGWPIYKGFDVAHPRIPEAHTIFLDGYKPDGTYNKTGPLAAPGKDVANLIDLYKACTGPKPPITDTCKEMQAVVAMFNNNYKDYTKLACADKNFVNTPIETLRRLYGWVPFNVDCPAGDNALLRTTGIDGDQKKFAAIQKIYIDLEYNYKTATAADTFNPYVKLIHGSNYLDMSAYAFSIDDAVGFQHYRGTGLIYAVGGSDGLDNKTKLDKSKLVNVSYGHPLNTTLWKSIGICSEKTDSEDLNPEAPTLDFFPPEYPCLISALNVDGNVYQFRLTQGPPNIAVNCDNLLQAAWCRQTNILPPNMVIGASTK